MMATFFLMMSYPFMVNAMVVGVLVSLCAALLGVSLVLKRYSMIGDGLSHVGFAASAVAYAFGFAPLSVALPVCAATAVLLLRIQESSRIRGDAAIALVCSGALALGVMTVSLTTGMNADVSNYMFGSILAMSRDDVVVSIVLGALILLLFGLSYGKIFAVTFDETFAAATGVRVDVYRTILALLTALTVVLGLRMMGALLISSLIVIPALSAMRVCRSFRSVTILSACLSIACFVVGVTASYAESAPTGPCVVLANVFAFVILYLAGRVRERT